MVEVTQADKAEAIRYWGNDNPPVELQAAFARHRIAALEEAARHFEEDAGLCDCFARSEGECACGAWYERKTYDADRIAASIRALKGGG